MTTAGLGGIGSLFELNVAMPVMIDAFLESVKLLANVTNVFVDKLLTGLEVNEERCRQLIEQSLMMVTSLAPKIGYEKAAAFAKEAFKAGKTIRELCRETKDLARRGAGRCARSLENDRTTRMNRRPEPSRSRWNYDKHLHGGRCTMARKLSRIARQGSFLLAAVAMSTGSPPAIAQDDVRVETPTKVVANPFSKGAAATVAVPEEPDTPRTVPTTYNNPFSRMSLAPSVAPPSRPGPISRWQRRNLLVDDATPVRTAILSANPLAGQETAWDQLPPAESLRGRRWVRRLPVTFLRAHILASRPTPSNSRPSRWHSRHGSRRTPTPHGDCRPLAKLRF